MSNAIASVFIALALGACAAPQPATAPTDGNIEGYAASASVGTVLGRTGGALAGRK